MQISRVPSHKRFNNEGFRRCATWAVSLKSACADNGLWSEHHNTATDIFALIWLLGCGSVAQCGWRHGSRLLSYVLFVFDRLDCIFGLICCLVRDIHLLTRFVMAIIL